MTDSEALDLRFANVVDVDFERLDGETIRFDVTLHHDDEGEAPEYADAWEVLDETGQFLGQRILLHAHSNAPFTRSATISIPAGVIEVVIRGHDMRHGYGGQALRLNLETGESVPMPAPAHTVP